MVTIKQDEVRDLAFRLNKVPEGGNPSSAGPRYLTAADLMTHIEGVDTVNVKAVIEDLVRTHPRTFAKGPLSIITW